MGDTTITEEEVRPLLEMLRADPTDLPLPTVKAVAEATGLSELGIVQTLEALRTLRRDHPQKYSSAGSIHTNVVDHTVANERSSSRRQTRPTSAEPVIRAMTDDEFRNACLLTMLALIITPLILVALVAISFFGPLFRR